MSRFVLPAVVACVLITVACGEANEKGPPGFSANKSMFWAANKLADGELFAYAGSPIKASAMVPDGPFANGVSIGTIAADGSFKITLPKQFPYLNEVGGQRTYCTSGLDFEFHTGYACASNGQAETQRQRNTCTMAPESAVQNIRLAARPMNGEAHAVTTVAELSLTTTYPYAIVVLPFETTINGCANCFFVDEATGLTTTDYTFVCYESTTLPANTLLGVFRANGPHKAADTLAVRVRPLTADDLKYLEVSGAP